jgi:chromosome segregation ATPase
LVAVHRSARRARGPQAALSEAEGAGKALQQRLEDAEAQAAARGAELADARRQLEAREADLERVNGQVQERDAKVGGAMLGKWGAAHQTAWGVLDRVLEPAA